MSVGTVITLIVAVMSSSVLAAAITAFVNSKRNRAQSETEARAQYTHEFKAIIAAHRDQIADLRADVETLKAASAQDRERYERAEDYIDVIVAGVYEGRYPPFPSRTQGQEVL